MGVGKCFRRDDIECLTVCLGRYMGKLQVYFDANNKIQRLEGNPVLLGGPNSDNPVQEDQSIKDEVDKWKYW